MLLRYIDSELYLPYNTAIYRQRCLYCMVEALSYKQFIMYRHCGIEYCGMNAAEHINSALKTVWDCYIK